MLITFTIDQIECRPIDTRSSYLIMFCCLRQVFMKCIIVHIDILRRRPSIDGPLIQCFVFARQSVVYFLRHNN